MMAVEERQIILTGLVSDVPYEFKIVSLLRCKLFF
jgi:hypothetical protein